MSYGEGHTRLDALKNKILKIGIDASNIRRGGGLTHLYELLNRNDLLFNKKYKIILWASSDILDVIEEKKWIKKVTNRSLNGNLFLRTMWQFLKLSESAKKEGCDILLIPGGSYYGTFKPVVSMHRNQLPFEYRELFRYRFSLTTIRLMMLRIFQLQTFRRSDGVIYLTEYCKKVVEEKLVNNSSMSVVIPHGFNTNLKKYFKPEFLPCAVWMFNKTCPVFGLTTHKRLLLEGRVKSTIVNALLLCTLPVATAQ